MRCEVLNVDVLVEDPADVTERVVFISVLHIVRRYNHVLYPVFNAGVNDGIIVVFFCKLVSLCRMMNESRGKCPYAEQSPISEQAFSSGRELNDSK